MRKEMNIKNIIGKGKAFEPPFVRRINYPIKEQEIWDSQNNIVIIMQCSTDIEAEIGYHICELLNREHKGRNRRMCLRDRSKVCNLCHDCDVDVLNPGNYIQTR